MELEWIKCQGGDWCQLNTVNLDSNNLDGLNGVYVLWCGQDGLCVKVGQGDIRDRLKKHKNDPNIQQYFKKNLLCSWAIVGSKHIDGVEKYLGERLKPIVAERFPDVAPIKVNIPSA